MRGIKTIAAAMAVSMCCLASPLAIAQTPDGVLDDASLKTMIDGLGYEEKPLSKGLLVTYKDDTWSFYVQMVLSPDTTKLGLNANLGKVDDLSTISAKKWLDLLVANGKIDPSVFYVNADSGELFLHRVIDNRGITPAILRTQFQNFVNNIADNSEIWDLTK